MLPPLLESERCCWQHLKDEAVGSGRICQEHVNIPIPGGLQDLSEAVSEATTEETALGDNAD